MRRKRKQWNCMTETEGETVGRRETGNCVSFRGTSGKGLAKALVTLHIIHILCPIVRGNHRWGELLVTHC